MNQTDYQRLLRGERLEPGADLSGADLRDLNLRGRILDRVDLTHADLRDVDLTGASLKGVIANRSQFQGANLSDASLLGAEFGWAHFEGAEASGAAFDGAQLFQSHFSAAQLEGAHFSGVTAWGADFSGAKLDNAAFDSLTDPQGERVVANLQRANFSSTSLSGARFVLANASGARFNSARGVETRFTGAQLDQAALTYAEFDRPLFAYASLVSTDWARALVRTGNFGGATLTKARFQNARLVEDTDLSGVRADAINLRNAVLTGARLDGALLTHATATDADFTDCVMTGANLNNAIVEGARLGGVQGDGDTMWPVGASVGPFLRHEASPSDYTIAPDVVATEPELPQPASPEPTRSDEPETREFPWAPAVTQSFVDGLSSKQREEMLVKLAVLESRYPQEIGPILDGLHESMQARELLRARIRDRSIDLTGDAIRDAGDVVKKIVAPEPVEQDKTTATQTHAAEATDDDVPPDEGPIDGGSARPSSGPTPPAPPAGGTPLVDPERTGDLEPQSPVEFAQTTRLAEELDSRVSQGAPRLPGEHLEDFVQETTARQRAAEALRGSTTHQALDNFGPI